MRLGRIQLMLRRMMVDLRWPRLAPVPAYSDGTAHLGLSLAHLD
jgi:hypothetical protein